MAQSVPGPSDHLGVAVLGTGAWGRNHVRALGAEPGVTVRWVVDPDQDARDHALALAQPGTQASGSAEAALTDPGVDAVIICSPAPTHAKLARAAIAAGKHLLIEKPLALDLDQASIVVTEAIAARRTLAVGHLMIYHPVVLRLAELVESGELGPLHYLHATRVNLGKLRRDENALWSFGPHDLSMIDLLVGEEASTVTARGQAFLQPGIEDVVFVTLRFPSGAMAHLHLSWLSPRKERRLTIVGANKMAEFDDVAVEKLRIYDRGYDRPPSFTEFGEYLAIRDGEVRVPHVPMVEPLRAMLRDFLHCLRTGARPRSDGAAGLRVVRALDAASRSLAADGAPVALRPGP
ncbi:MAG: Gfo/Idh/MocA family oxidoreductase [Dermatophilaceae bacterium]|nr:Gfo/Idh/MocA family oxidoreductase [Dermatophilaceae bacterium]